MNHTKDEKIFILAAMATCSNTFFKKLNLSEEFEKIPVKEKDRIILEVYNICLEMNCILEKMK